MIEVSDEQFEDMINRALDSLPGEHVKNIQNVAILMADDPSPEQRTKLQLRDDESLYGLYEGVPLTQRQGQGTMLPDRITLFKNPIRYGATFLSDVEEQVRHTLWHEIGHYYGLDHKRIHELEQ